MSGIGSDHRGTNQRLDAHGDQGLDCAKASLLVMG